LTDEEIKAITTWVTEGGQLDVDLDAPIAAPAEAREVFDADIELDQLLQRTSKVAGPDALEGLSPQLLDEVIANAGYSQTPGAAVFEHLQRALS
jgi:hypothetical protein